MYRTSTRIHAGLIAVVATAAVATASVAVSAAGAQQTSRDSAGIRIFDHRAVTTPSPAFLISERPVRAFDGGESMGSSVSGATAVSTLFDGRWVVGTSATQSVGQVVRPPADAPPGDSARLRISFPTPTRVRELRVYDSLGTFLSRGGTADSTIAGHFRGSVSFIREMPTGNLLVATLAGDLNLHRLDGTFEREVVIAANERFVGLFEDGSMLLSRARTPAPFVDGTLAGYRLHKQTTDYFRASFDSPSRTLLPFVTEQPWYVRSNVPLPGATPSASPLSPWPVTTTTNAFISRNVIWLFDRVKWELRQMDEHGVLKAIVRPPVPERVANAVMGGRYRTDSAYAETMLVDDQGRLWMDAGDNARLSNSDYSLRRWLVVDPSEGLLGSVVMPPGYRPLAVRGSIIIGSQRQTRFSTPVIGAHRIVPVRR